jgi:hypothetical protein
MRSKLFLAGITFAIGCGGGGGKKAMIVDAMVDSPTVDAAATCSVNCELSAQVCGPGFNMPTFPALRFGGKDVCSTTTTTACTMDNQCPTGETCRTRVDGDWFVDFTEAPLAGRRAFSIGLIMDEKPNPDILFIRLMKPMAGNFPVNTATTFDPSPTTEVPVAWSFWFGDATIDAGTGQITDEAQFYYANMGSITLTSVGEADGAAISGSTAPITWREIDDNGVDVAGGCTASIGVGSQSNSGFTFDLVQMAGAFQPQQNGEGYPRQVSPALAESLNKRVNEKLAKLKIQQY